MLRPLRSFPELRLAYPATGHLRSVQRAEDAIGRVFLSLEDDSTGGGHSHRVSEGLLITSVFSETPCNKFTNTAKPAESNQSSPMESISQENRCFIQRILFACFVFKNDSMKLWPDVNGELVFHDIKHSICLHTAGCTLQKKKFNTQKHVAFPPLLPRE